MVRTPCSRSMLGLAILLVFLVGAGSLQAADPPLAAGVAPILLEDPGLDGVSAPRLRGSSRVEPEYPGKALAAGVEAKVQLLAVVRKDGTVPEVSVLDCTAPGIGFEDSAARAVRGWRFRPATKDGRPVDSYTVVQLAFEIDGSGSSFTRAFANAWRPSLVAEMNALVAGMTAPAAPASVLPAGYVRHTPQGANTPEIVSDIEGEGSNARYLAYAPSQPDGTPVSSPQPLSAR